MTCGGCKHSFSLFVFLKVHWLQSGCSWSMAIWERVLRSRREGHSGRRILRGAFPETYPSRPMPEAVKQAFRAREASQN